MSRQRPALAWAFIAALALSGCNSTTPPETVSAEAVPPATDAAWSYAAAIQQAIAKNFTTIDEKKVRIASDMVVALTVDREGRLLNSALEKGSEFASLDADILSAVRRSAPFGKLPNDLPGETMSIKLHFCLGDVSAAQVGDGR